MEGHTGRLNRCWTALIIFLGLFILNIFVFQSLNNDASIVYDNTVLRWRDDNDEHLRDNIMEPDGVITTDRIDQIMGDDEATPFVPSATSETTVAELDDKQRNIKNIKNTEKIRVTSDARNQSRRLKNKSSNVDKKKQESKQPQQTKVTVKQPSNKTKLPPRDTDKPSNDTAKVYVTGNAYGARRTGNRLFVYASMMTTAWRYSMTPILSPKFELQNYFNIDVELDERASNWSRIWDGIGAKGSAIYSDVLETLEERGLANKNISINGYFQSWRFFEAYEERLRKTLVFKDDVINLAKDELRRIVRNVTFDNDPVKAKIPGGTLLTLHVRRGDIMGEINQENGYTFPGRSYFQNSMQFFADVDPNLHVVVCCQDLEWCRSNLIDLPATVYFSERNNAIIDLAIMSMGEHVIMTTGTYGWWAAWLANGITIYYSNWPRHGSNMYNQRYIRQDYFMPHWIGMT